MKFLLLLLLIHSNLSLSIGQNLNESLPLPKVKPLNELTVLYVENPRFEKISSESILRILDTTRVLAKKNFDLDLFFKYQGKQSADELLRKLERKHLDYISAQAVNVKENNAEAILAKAIADDIRRNHEDFKSIREYASAHLHQQPTDLSDSALVNAIANTHVTLLRRWQTEKLIDGIPTLNKYPLEEFYAWVALGYTDIKQEVIITNQLIASAEKSNNSVHSALRGGISNGITVASKSSSNGAMSILSTYPAFSNEPSIVRLRGGQIVSPALSERYAAAILAHEIGHQILHLGHPFENNFCIMRPPALLNFRDWLNHVDADRCKLKSSSNMTPGQSIKFMDIRENKK